MVASMGGKRTKDDRRFVGYVYITSPNAESHLGVTREVFEENLKKMVDFTKEMDTYFTLVTEGDFDDKILVVSTEPVTYEEAHEFFLDASEQISSETDGLAEEIRCLIYAD